MATGPWCFKCLYVMPSRPAAEVDLVWSIVNLIIHLGCKGVEGQFWGVA